MMKLVSQFITGLAVASAVLLACTPSLSSAQQANANVVAHDRVTNAQTKDPLREAARQQYVRMQEAWLGDVIKKGGWRPDSMRQNLSANSQDDHTITEGIPVKDLQSLLTNQPVDMNDDQIPGTKWNDVNMVDEVTQLLVHIQNSATNSVNYYAHRLTVENIQGDIFISLYNVHEEFCHRLMNYGHYDPVIFYGVGYPQPQPVSDFCQDGDNVVVWKVPEYHNLLRKDFMKQIARR